MKNLFIVLLCLLCVPIFSYSDNNGKDLLQISNDLSCQVKSKNLRNIYLFLSKYKWVKTKSDDFINIFFAHLRYNYELTRVTRLESFVQYQNNRMLDINARA